MHLRKDDKTLRFLILRPLRIYSLRTLREMDLFSSYYNALSFCRTCFVLTIVNRQPKFHNLQVSGLVNHKVFALAVSPKESFGQNSGCFARGSVTSRKDCRLNMTDR